MYKYKLFSILIALVLGFSFASCSSDDDNDGDNGSNGGNGGGSSSSVNNPLLNEGGLLLTKIMDNYGEGLKFVYDEQFRPITVIDYDYGDEENSIRINFDKKTISLWDGMGNIPVTFDSKGHITKVKGSWDVSEDGERDYGSIEQTFTYDGNGHLTAVTSEWKETEIGGDWDFTDHNKINTTLVWKDNNLLSMKSNSTFYEDGKAIEIYDNELKFIYGTKKNTYKQWPGIIACDDQGSVAAGLHGNFSDLLPTNCIYYIKEEFNYEGGYDQENEYEYKVSYTLNENGSINTDTYECTNDKDEETTIYTFSYSPAVKSAALKTSITEPIFSTKSSIEKTKRIVNSLKKLSFAPRKRNTTKNN